MNDIEPSKEKHYTTIRITKQLREALKTRGKKGDTYDTIIKAGMGITFEPMTEVTTSTIATVEPQRKRERKLPLAALSSGLSSAEPPGQKLLPRISKNPELEEKLLSLWSSGMESQEIAKAMGYSRQTIDSNLGRLSRAGRLNRPDNSTTM